VRKISTPRAERSARSRASLNEMKQERERIKSKWVKQSTVDNLAEKPLIKVKINKKIKKNNTITPDQDIHKLEKEFGIDISKLRDNRADFKRNVHRRFIKKSTFDNLEIINSFGKKRLPAKLHTNEILSDDDSDEHENNDKQFKYNK